MTATSFDDRLAQERRARLQAERLLALRSEELYAANRNLADHANELSFQVIETREQNEILRDVTTDTKAKLEDANQRLNMAQRRMWDALTATEDGFVIFDQDRRLVAANPAFFDMFDGAADVAEGASYEAILHIAVEEGIVDLQGTPPEDWIARMLARWDQNPIPKADVKLWNGAYIRLNDKLTPQGDFVSLAVDITPNIRRERQLRAARDAALAASRAKSNFLANMSHEIRTPMNGVVSMAELLRDTPLTEEQMLYADTIKNSGEALLVIINDVLDFSKIEAGKMELHSESFDLNGMVHEIFRLMKPVLKDKDLDLRLDYDIFLPEALIGDRGRIRQVLTNLIGNAVKFTAEGHVSVHVMADPNVPEDKGLTLRIVVQDTGVGIAEDKQAHVFGEFNQVEDERNRRHDGTGLGLAISRRLVQMMGGEMWLESEEGKGSAFGFTLPVAKDPDGGAGPVAGLPHDQARVLLVGGDSTLEEQFLNALSRLHAEPSLVRRAPCARDLEGTQAVVLCGETVSVSEVAAALDENGFAGARLTHLKGPKVDGFIAIDPGENGLADLRAAVLGTGAPASPSSGDVNLSPVKSEPQMPTPESTPPSVDEREQTAIVEDPAVDRSVPADALVSNGVSAPIVDHPADLQVSSELRRVEEHEASDVDQPATSMDPSGNMVAEPIPEPVSDISTPVESAPNAETSSTASVASALADPSQDAPPATNAPNRDRLRVLAAEDNKTNQLVFKTMLKALDIDLEVVNNGVELVDAYRSDVPDLIMTDISMPEMDGLDAARAIRSIEAENGHPRIPIIAMTAHALEGDKERILAAGLDDYVTKPLKKALLHEKIAEVQAEFDTAK
ncbi:ATP-binding protein [Gymnodinialimonas sp. 2305UL16-5]|uniref:ATP-binding protein n=1 Tax=Gymnodinialimonas mytili TaxID=3126503 RepID=UPI0030A78A84